MVLIDDDRWCPKCAETVEVERKFRLVDVHYNSMGKGFITCPRCGVQLVVWEREITYYDVELYNPDRPDHGPEFKPSQISPR